ncbi:bifunctional metallophosphatase/5'-nucleotidase [Pseudoalteromonas fenneropenaei]|uniref:Bifunctional metallophosphatase/5'-nucleotidase n=1 Tax=Pseudoalteromonas fenneropenaei TaxID=1737459 RepID=A0ABV7CNK1_9GAMM
MPHTIKQLLLVALISFYSSFGLAKNVDITFLHANDVYEMTPVNGGKFGGLARVETIMKELRQRNPNTFSILAGDLFSPSAIGTAVVDGDKLAGKQMVDVLNAMRWDFMTLGNHEFDNGYEPLLARLAEAQFTIFSSNVLDPKTNKPLANLKGEVVFSVDGVKVALIGVVLPSLAKDFVKILDPLAQTKAAIEKVKNQGADIVVLVTHQEIETDLAFANQLDVDLILGGHEHENMYFRRGAHFVPVAKADANARSVYIHHLQFDTERKTLKVHSELKLVTAAIAEDKVIAARAKAWQNKAFDAFRAQGFEPTKVIATTKTDLNGLEADVRNGVTNLTQVIAQSELLAYPDAQAAIYNAGSIRIDDVLPAGELSEYDVIRILPFGGDYSLVEIPGDLLIQTLDAGAGNKGTGGYLQMANISRRGNQWQLDGADIDAKREYKIVIASFLIERGDANLTFLVNNPRIKVLSQDKVDARKALIAYLASHAI